MNIKIRKLDRERDFKNGFLETLENLRNVGLTPGEAREIYDSQMNLNPVYNLFVADLNGEVVGAMTLLIEQKLIHKGGLVCQVEDLAVKKEFEKQGIGRALMSVAKKEAKKKGCYKIILHCSDKNIPFYKNMGFERRSNLMRIDL